MRGCSVILIAVLACVLPQRAHSAPPQLEEFETAEFELVDPGRIDWDGSDALVWSRANQAAVDRALSVPIPRTIPKGHLQYVIEHRSRTAIDDEPFHNFLGFDGGNVKIGFGLTYGLLDHMDLGVYRLNGTVEKFDTYQFSAKYHVLQEADHFLDLAVIGGGTVFTVHGEDDGSGGFGSMLLGKSFTKHLYLSAGGLYHSNSSSFDKTANDEESSTSIFGSAGAHITPGIMLVGEVSAPVDGYDAQTVAWAGGVKFLTHGHTFSLILGNTQYVSLDGLAAGTAFDTDEVIFGFSITRSFQLIGR